MKKLLTIILLILLALISYSQISGLEIPKCDTTYINHEYYCLLYSEQHEQSYWVSYDLIPSDTIVNHERKNRYEEDDLISTGSANGDDYKKTGYDRGHLAPARDFRYEYQSVVDINYYSNLSPQKPEFNRGIWRVLEENVTHLTRKYDKIYIVTGPILTDNLPTIGDNKVSIPNFYYKVIITYKNGEYKGIGFILPNKKGEYTLDKYCVSIDFVEVMTGFDFFHKLDNHIENVIERNSNYKSIF